MSALLVKYGRSAFVGLFTGSSSSLANGDSVVVVTPRGAELGIFLCPARESIDDHLAVSGGKFLRSVTREDLNYVDECKIRETELLQAAEARIAANGLPMMVLDCEFLLENTGAILHLVAWDECHADDLFVELSTRFGVKVSALDQTKIPALDVHEEQEAGGCGKPGCGSGSGGCSGCGTSGEKSGCSTGSCSRGSVQSAEELGKHFAELREKMESRSRRTPLV